MKFVPELTYVAAEMRRYFSHSLPKGPVFSSLLTCICMLLYLSASSYGGMVEGVVITELGPLDKAVVKAYPTLHDALYGSNAAVSTPGAKSGFFTLELPPGSYYLTAAGTGKGEKFFSFHGANPIKVEDKPVWLPFAASVLTAAVEKSSGVSKISGSVIYKGKPVSDAQVSLYADDEKNLRGLGLQTISSDASGRFSFMAPPAPYILVARKRVGGKTGMPLKKGDLFCFFGANPLVLHEKSEAAIEINCNPKDDQQAFLAPGISMDSALLARARSRQKEPARHEAAVAGRVVTIDGKPVNDMQVTAYLRDPARTFQMHHLRLATENMVRTDKDGRYFLPLKSTGSYYLVARQHGGESPLKGELYGLYEDNSSHAIEAGLEVVTADITVGRVMSEAYGKDAEGVREAVAAVMKAPSVIARDTVWSGEVLVEGAVLVARPATLRIEPGTVIRFKRIDSDKDGIGDGELRVTGRIIAKGTEEKPIRFSSAEKEPRAGDWSYLLLFTSGGENVIEHAIFEHAFTGLQAHFSRAVVRDSTFINNIEGIRFGRAELDIEHNKIADNDIGIRYHRLEGPVTIRSNIVNNNGIGLFLVPSTQKFVNFSAEKYVPDLRYYMAPTIMENIITDNLNYNFQMGERLATDITLAGNWWGSEDPEKIRATLFDKARDPELGSVTIVPVLSKRVQLAGPRKGGRL